MFGDKYLFDLDAANKLKGLGDSILQAILDDDSDKLLDLISSHSPDKTIFFLPCISKRLPRFLSGGPSLLSLSCFFASMNCFRLLLGLNSEADEEDSQGRLAIHFAAAGGSLEMLRELDQIFPQPAAKPDRPDKPPPVTRHFYIRNSQKDDIYNYQDYETERTPMHYAAQFGRLDAVKYLYLKGARLDTYRDVDNHRPIELACLYGHVDVVRFFVENGVSLTDEKWMYPIHYACIGGDAETIEYLISQKVDLNVMYRSIPPINYAAKFGSLAAIKVLVKHNVAFKNRGRKNPPIIEAALNGHLDVVRYFIEQGCDPNLYDSNGQSILYAAVKRQKMNIVKYLLSKGATVFPDGKYAKKEENPSKLPHRACKQKLSTNNNLSNPLMSRLIVKEEMLLLLLNNIDLDEYAAENPVDDLKNYIITFNSLNLFNLLFEHKILDGDCTDLYTEALNKKSDQLIQALFDKNISFDPNSQKLQSSIVKHSDQALFNRFLDRGVKFNPENIPSLTADAIATYRVELVKYFLDLKVLDPNTKHSITSERLYHKFPYHSYINYILDLSLSFASPCRSSYKEKYEPGKVPKDADNLIEIMKLILDYGFKFADDKPPINPLCVYSIETKDKVQLFFELYILHEDAYPNTVDLSTLSLECYDLLLYGYEPTIAERCLDMFLKHNIVLHTTQKSPELADISNMVDALHKKIEKYAAEAEERYNKTQYFTLLGSSKSELEST